MAAPQSPGATLAVSALRIYAPTNGITLPPPPSSFAAFTRIEPRFNLGYTPDRLWLRILITNSSARASTYYLATGQRYMRPLALYEKTDGHFRQVFYNDADQPFDDRPLLSPYLTFPVALVPHQRKELLIYVGDSGELSMSLKLLRPEEMLKTEAHGIAITMLFEGVLFTLALINIFYYWAVKRPAHLFYALQEVMIGLFIANAEGFTFQYLWPHVPLLNDYATRILGHGANACVILFGIAFLDLRRASPALFRVALVDLTIPVVCLVLLPVLSTRLSNEAGLVGASATGIIMLLASIRVIAKGDRSAMYFLVAWLGMGAGIMTFALSTLGAIQTVMPPIQWVKCGALVEAFVLLLGLFDQVRRLDRQYDQAQRALVESLQSRLEEARHTLGVESERDAAAKALLQKVHEIRTASHDVSQPIYALRLALAGIARRLNDVHVSESLDRMLDYIEDVLHGDLANEPMLPRASPATWGEMFRQVAEDYHDEASQKSLRIRCVPSSLTLNVAVLPIRRVLNNLVSNAIRHSSASRLVIGLRRDTRRPAIQIMDDGEGLPDVPEGEIPGTGLGLSIVKEICAREGWQLRWYSRRGRGTRFSIEVPA